MTPLDAHGIYDAADSVFLMLYICLAMAFFCIVGRLRRGGLPWPTSRDDTANDTAAAAKVVGLLLVSPMVCGAVIVRSSIWALAVTFPLWGAFLGLLLLFIVWIVVRSLTLGHDDASDYTIEVEHRADVDARWKKESKSRGFLHAEFIGWIAGLVIAILWLKHITHYKFF